MGQLHSKGLKGLAGLALASAAMTASATPLMSSDWASQACDSFNSNDILTKELAGGWVNNDAGRGYKVIHLYRTDCGKLSRVEMRISPKDGKAMCVYGGKVENLLLNGDSDYVMHASTQEWREMGAGEYGPMRAMMTGALQFDGPKLEAMSVMGPFEQFLLLPGKVSGSDECPTRD